MHLAAKPGDLTPAATLLLPLYLLLLQGAPGTTIFIPSRRRPARPPATTIHITPWATSGLWKSRTKVGLLSSLLQQCLHAALHSLA